MDAWLYIIHFHGQLHHAKHYVGVTTDPIQRAIAHATGNGSRLMAAAQQAGIQWTMTLFQCSRHRMYELERRLKSRKNTAEHCHICTPRSTRKTAGLTPIDPELLTITYQGVCE